MSKRQPTFLLLTALLFLLSCLLPTQAATAKKPRLKRVQDTAAALIEGSGPPYAGRPEAMALADEIAERHGLDRKWVRRTLGKARHVPQVVKLITPPPVSAPRNWQQYRSRFLEAERVQAGVAFWQTHRELLERASSTYGVPAEIIIGIIGVETYYGRHIGRYRVLDALATLAFDFPAEHPRAAQRTAFFRAELGEFLKLRQQAGADPFKARGSYAGAMGIPQFMPSSWARHAVDFDGDGRVDLVDSTADAIGSVASYFKAHHWQPGMPTHFPVDFDYERLDMPALLAPDIKPTFAVDQFTAKGILLGAAGRGHAGPLALVELQNGDYSPSYVAGTDNFYVVTRYNWSSYYALAVIELGQAVASALPAKDLQASTTPSNTGCSVSTQRSTSDAPICR
ncbi:lytic murein transglycosylase B [Curvibacter sp. PAE-UM]|uniref:lytic murein transglycosylase B n=1 Tax=Curvibacter sp. PAE-UM TaxID=1714344 RepID=UPI000A96E6D4